MRRGLAHRPRRSFARSCVDALRDRRTLVTVIVASVFMGPLVLLAISGLVASLETRAEQREVYVSGLAHAPTLRNFLERQTYTVKEAPADFEARLRTSKFSDAVVVVPDDFEAALVRGECAGRRDRLRQRQPALGGGQRRGSSACSPASRASAPC